jgi:hypothetical protein
MKRKKSPYDGQPELAMQLVGQEEIIFSRSEKNLEFFGFFGAHDPRMKPTRRVIPLGTADAAHRPSSVTLEAPERLGLPSTADLKVWNAFSDFFFDLRAQCGCVENPIRFTGPQIVAKLGRTKSGGLYDFINEWGQRMASTTITSSGVFYHKGSKKFIDTTDHVFRKFTRIQPDAGAGQHNVMFEVVLEDLILDNLNDMFVVRKDPNALKKLDRPMAIALFSLLHVWFYASKGDPIEVSYSNMCKRLGVVEYLYPTKIKSTMGRALDELASIDYLHDWKLLKNVTQTAYKFRLIPGKELLRILKLTQKKLLSDRKGIVATIDDSPVVLELMSIGISRAKAIELSKMGPQQEMLDKIDYVNSLIAIKKDKLFNPSGYAIDCIQQGISVPANFVTSRKREEIIAAHRKEREKQQQELLTSQAYQQWCNERVEEIIEGRYTEQSLEAELLKRLPALLEDYPSLKRSPREVRLQQARLILQREVRSDLDLPSEEQWAEMEDFRNVQVALF